jgi:hypothetical protein
MGGIVCGSDCHSERLDPLLRGRTKQFGGVRQNNPCGVEWSQNENVCGANRYSVGWCGWECHSVSMGGGLIIKAPNSALIQGEYVARIPL